MLIHAMNTVRIPPDTHPIWDLSNTPFGTSSDTSSDTPKSRHAVIGGIKGCQALHGGVAYHLWEVLQMLHLGHIQGIRSDGLPRKSIYVQSSLATELCLRCHFQRYRSFRVSGVTPYTPFGTSSGPPFGPVSNTVLHPSALGITLNR